MPHEGPSNLRLASPLRHVLYDRVQSEGAAWLDFGDSAAEAAPPAPWETCEAEEAAYFLDYSALYRGSSLMAAGGGA